MSRKLNNSSISDELRTEELGSQLTSEFGNPTPNSYDAIFRRMMIAVGATHAVDVANAMGISESSVSGAKKRKKIPNTWYTAISKKTGVSIDWLRTGEGEMWRGDGKKVAADESDGAWPATPEVEQNGLGTIICDNCELVLVPMLETVLSGGTGSMETGGAALKTYAFRYDFLKRKGNPKEMGLFRVSGDSMADDILDNDVVLIDKSQNQPVPGKIFAVSIHGLTYLKQVDAGQDGLILSSANERYAPITVDLRGDEQDGVYIIGRMVWLCREFD